MNADVSLLLTADGSHTAVNRTLGKTYHSIHGAVQESERVYMDLGLRAAIAQFSDEPLHVFEMGLGTGLNALLTLREAESRGRSVYYVAIDAFPLALADARQLNYDQQLGTAYLQALHEAPWQEPVRISPFFTLTKLAGTVQDLRLDERFHLIYFDAFAPTAQPELWEPAILGKMAGLLLPGGILTTYCSKSNVQRNLRAGGFRVEKHAGPLNKREVIRAIRE